MNSRMPVDRTCEDRGETHALASEAPDRKTSPDKAVFLFEVDITLLDNDHGQDVPTVDEEAGGRLARQDV
jgi:hypothetical protein